MKDIKDIAELMLSINNTDEMVQFLNEILTDNERRDLVIRWELMNRLYDDGTAYTEALQINNRVTLYFDRALFFMAQGYMQGINREI